MYNAYITKIKNIKPHPNADRLNIGECFGNLVVIGKEYTEEELYVYFPVDGQLSEEFADKNNLIRKKDENGNNIGGYLEANRAVKAIRLRGERSDGLVLPLNTLSYTGAKLEKLEEGFAFSCLNNKEICKKYIPRRNSSYSRPLGSKTRKKKAPIAPLFAEHADTAQLAYNLGAFKAGQVIEISLKIHGTSQRTAHLPVLKGYRRNVIDYLFRKEGKAIYDYGYVSGTRRTVLEDYKGGYCGDNTFREQHSKVFEGKLKHGETVYYEVAGFTTDGTPIMGSGKVPKEAQAEYGKSMTFSYGCESGESKLWVYRMTYTTPEGEVIEYSPHLIRFRCAEIGVQAVPVFEKFIIPEGVDAGEYVKRKAEQYYEGADPIGKTHVREGVVVRIVDSIGFYAFKHKNFLFKQISGIIAENASENLSEDILTEM